MNSSTKKKLLILAASIYQIEAIVAAQRMGLFVITTDNRPDNPGHALADRSYSIDTTDHRAVLAMARREEIDGILAPCTDVAMPTVAFVAEQLGLQGPSVESVEIACDKARFRRFQEKRGLPAPKFRVVKADDGTTELLPDCGQWLVKPTQASGSKGIKLVDGAKDMRDAISVAAGFSKSGEVILEEYIEGHQGTCEGWLEGGIVRWHCLLDRQTAELPYTTTIGHQVPTCLSSHQESLVLEAIQSLFHSLEVSQGPFDCDFVLSGDTVYILEASPRLGGNSISQLLRSACSVDLIEHTIAWACRMPQSALPRHPVAPRAIVLFGVQKRGVLQYDRTESARLATEPWVEGLAWDSAFGAEVHPFTDGRYRVGQAMIRANSKKELSLRVRELHRRLKIDSA